MIARLCAALTVRARVLAARARFRPKSNEPMIRLGTDYGGWWLPESSLRPGAVAYCAGAGEDISFDLELLRRGLVVRTLDPTPRAIAYVEREAPAGADNFQFLPVGLWDEDTTLKFYAPQNPAHVSHSATNLQGTDVFFEAPVMELEHVMGQVGDQRVDILKLDIEGAEIRVMRNVLASDAPPTVLAVEYDQPLSLREIARSVRLLVKHGYSLQKIDVWNYTFVRDLA